VRGNSDKRMPTHELTPRIRRVVIGLLRALAWVGTGQSVEGSAVDVRQLEYGVQAVSRLGRPAFSNGFRLISNWIIEDLNERRAKIVISQHQRRTKPLDIDKDIYKWRHLSIIFSAS
jgi:hypothetical protein